LHLYGAPAKQMSNENLPHIGADAPHLSRVLQVKAAAAAVAAPAARPEANQSPAVAAASSAQRTPAAAAAMPAASRPGGLDRLPLGVRYLDLVLLIPATVAGLSLRAPLFGFLVGLLAWVGQRLLAQADRRWIKRAKAPRTQLGLNLFEAFGRIWLLAGAIVLSGVVGGRADGLTAALVIFGAYSVVFMLKLLAGPPSRTAASKARPQAGAASGRRGVIG
jgi:biotin carboxyl carrier protein